MDRAFPLPRFCPALFAGKHGGQVEKSDLIERLAQESRAKVTGIRANRTMLAFINTHSFPMCFSLARLAKWFLFLAGLFIFLEKGQRMMVLLETEDEQLLAHWQAILDRVNQELGALEALQDASKVDYYFHSRLMQPYGQMRSDAHFHHVCAAIPRE